MNAPNIVTDEDAREVSAAKPASGRPAKARPGVAQEEGGSVRERLLEQALDLIRKRGFNGFSYRDLAERVGVKTSSIHYYFPTKEDLALEAVKEYSGRVARHIASIDPALPVQVQAELYLEPWRRGCRQDLVCLAGMLASEVGSLPDPVHAVLQDFHRLNEQWLTTLLERAHAEATADGMPAGITPEALAQLLFAALQHGLVSARLFKQLDRVEPAAALLLAAVSKQRERSGGDPAEPMNSAPAVHAA